MMEFVTKMVQENASVSQEQAHQAIEAVMAYITHELQEVGIQVNDYLTSNNGSSVGGFDIGSVLESYREKFGDIAEIAKRHK